MIETAVPAWADLSHHDRMELVVFAYTVDHHGDFDYAYRTEPPHFRDADLHAIAADADRLSDYLDAVYSQIEQWWDETPDAADLYDTHAAARETQRAARSRWAVASDGGDPAKLFEDETAARNHIGKWAAAHEINPEGVGVADWRLLHRDDASSPWRDVLDGAAGGVA